MLASQLKLGDIVRYAGTQSHFMDMMVITIEDGWITLSRPYIIINEYGDPDLCNEHISVPVSSSMPFVHLGNANYTLRKGSVV